MLFARVLRFVQARVRRVFRFDRISHFGIRLPVHQEFSEKMRAVLYSGRYESEEIDLVRRYLHPRDRVLEFGTGLGFITVACAQICGSESVQTYEANPAMLSHIRETFRLNRVSPTLIGAAVAPVDGTIELNTGKDFWSSSCLARKDCHTVFSVPAVAFDDAVARFSPTFIILDIEGAEERLLDQRIHRCVNKLLIEMHGELIGATKVVAVRQWLESNGFEMVEEDGETLYLERTRSQPKAAVS